MLAGCDDIAEAYAKVCHSAISGMGTDEKALIRLMVTCSHEVMRDTRDAYARLYDTDLVDAMSGEWAIGGDFKNILCALAKKHPANVILGEYDYEPDVSALRDAVEGLGTDEAALIDVLANKTPEQIAELKDRYQAAHGEMLKERIKAETTGLFESAGFRNTLMGLLTPREEQIAFYLKEAFEGWFSNDDWGLISMLVHRTPEEMKEISQAVHDRARRRPHPGHPRQVRGRLREGSRRARRARARTIARGIKAAMSGWISTNKGALIALLTHRDAEMKTLRQQFEKEPNKSLQCRCSRTSAAGSSRRRSSRSRRTPRPRASRPGSPRARKRTRTPSPSRSPRRREPEGAGAGAREAQEEEEVQEEGRVPGRGRRRQRQEEEREQLGLVLRTPGPTATGKRPRRARAGVVKEATRDGCAKPQPEGRNAPFALARRPFLETDASLHIIELNDSFQ